MWCPPGWRVVPETMTHEMLAAAWPVAEGDGVMTKWREEAERNRYRATLDAAPKPPSGWTKGYPEDGRHWCPGGYSRESVLGYWDEANTCAWWTQFPPAPIEPIEP